MTIENTINTSEKRDGRSRFRKIVDTAEGPIVGLYTGILAGILGGILPSDAHITETVTLGTIPATELLCRTLPKHKRERNMNLFTYGLGAATSMTFLNYMANK